ncbi:MAG: glycoside hydrolase family 95 protein [Roseburia sp.]|nr:glycoside hydrolase family 95 protein [Roseburia sp.]
MSRLWYRQPAESWEEALPLGNGRLGAMVFGGVFDERIQVNEESIWYGGKQERLNPDAKAALPKVRELIRQGRISRAQELMSVAMAGCPNSMHPYQTLGDIRLSFRHKGKVGDYERSLDLEEGVCRVAYSVDGSRYERNYFVSNPAQAMLMRFEAQGEESLSFTATLGRGKFFDGVKRCGDEGILLYGNLGEGGSRFAMQLIAQVTGGKVSVVGESLMVEDAREARLIFGADTTYQHRGEGLLTQEALQEGLNRQLQKLSREEFETLWAEHVRDYRNLYGRVELQLWQSGCDAAKAASEIPTDRRLKLAAKGEEDVGLHQLLFDYGRYLLISCSREGTLPATLQGIWNQDFEPAWDSKYTININTEMNYWPAEICNLSECHKPLFVLLERMRVNGRRTAREMYGCRGFVAHHNTDIHGDTEPQDLWLPATFWSQGAAWLATHLWSHYLYTQDGDFLREAFPVLAEAALFYVDFLVEYQGYLVTSPSVSPENTYVLPNGEKGCCCMGPTMDNQLIRDLFTMCLDSYELLGEEAEECRLEGVESMRELMADIAKKREKLPPTRIGSDGRIMEWLEEYEEEEPGHRHISHLYGLYPSEQITVDGTPKLAQAARETLEHRLRNGGGHTGWSRAWITNLYAKLWDGESACESIRAMLAHSTYPNLFDKHPPFQIDGNFGVCAAIANMLVQSSRERVVLLPALPEAWESGSVKGLRLVGNALIDISWERGRLSCYRIQAMSDYSSIVKYSEISHIIKLKKGESKICEQKSII